MNKKMRSDNKIVVLYHADCKDGFAAAWSAWKKFGDGAEYIPVYHGRPIPEGLKDRQIYMLDFTYDQPFMSELIEANERVTAIDHHASQEAITKLTQDYSYDTEHSGAVLAWKYFHPDTKIPKLLSVIEDQDLFKFKLHGTLELCTYINALEREFLIWDRLVNEFEDPKLMNEYIEEGKLLVQYNDRLMREIAKEARWVDFMGHKVCMVNAPHRFATAIAQMLYKKSLFSIVWNERNDRISVSLRAESKNKIDVSAIAKKFGGGGHPHSAGFSLPLGSELPWTPANDKV